MMSARGDFLNYALSLMRSHNDEHSDVLPVLDVCSLKHVAYVFQALIYWIKAMNLQTTLDTSQMDRKRSDAAERAELQPRSGRNTPCVVQALKSRFIGCSYERVLL